MNKTKAAGSPVPSSPVREPREVIREEPLMHGAILAALGDQSLTVPEIARAVGRRSEEVLYWVMGMRRYRMVIELPDAGEDGYFRYRRRGGQE